MKNTLALLQTTHATTPATPSATRARGATRGSDPSGAPPWGVGIGDGVRAFGGGRPGGCRRHRLPRAAAKFSHRRLIRERARLKSRHVTGRHL